MKKLFTKIYKITAVTILILVTTFAAKAQFTRNSIATGVWASAVARDNSGNIYVVEDPGFGTSAEVLKYTGGKGAPTVIYTADLDDNGGALDDYAVGLAVTSNGDVYVSAAPEDNSDNGRIIRLVYNSATGTYTPTTFLTGSENVNFPFISRFTSLAVDANDNLLVIETDFGDPDSTPLEVAKYAATAGVPQVANYSILYNFSKVPDGNYTNPVGLTVDASGNIYVAEPFNKVVSGADGGQVIKLTKSTGYSASQFTSGQYTTALGSDALGNIYATTSTYTSNGTYIPFSLVEYPGGSASSPVTLYTGLGGGNLDFFPFGIAALSPNDIFVADGFETLDATPQHNPIKGNFAEIIGAPATQASNVSFSNITKTTASINWTNGSGASRAVFIAASTSGDISLTNGTLYTANTAFGSGTAAGDGWYCIYNGSGSTNSVDISNLSESTGYKVMAIEYNGSTGLQNYLTTTAINNPNTFTTADSTPPTVNAITATGASTTNATSVGYTVTFSEAVTGVDNTDFTATTSGVSTTGITVTPVSSSVYTVTVNGVSGNGTLRLDLNSSGTSIADLAGNAISGGFTGGDTYTIDQTAPTFTGVRFLSTHGTYAKIGDVVTLTFGVSEAIQTPYVTIDGHLVTAVIIDNNINIYSASYTMISSDEEGRIDFNIMVTDLAGNSAATGAFSGVSIEFDKTPPTVVISAPSVASIGNTGTASTVTYTVAYADANFYTSNLTNAGITLNTTGTATGTVNITGTVNVTGAGTSYTVSISNITGSGTLGISVGAGFANDLAGNTDAGGGPSATFTVDNTAPTVSSITATTPGNTNPTNSTSVVYTVTFSKPVTSVDASDFTLTTSGASGTVTAVSGSGSTYTVTVGAISGNGTVRLDLNSSGTGITDFVGNAISGGFTGGDTYTVDQTLPTATISAPLVTQVGNSGSGTVTYTVTYSDANFSTSSLTNTGIMLNTTGTATGNIDVSGSGISYTVTISGITGIGTLGISVAGGNASDLAGNTDAGAGPSATFNVVSSDATLSSLAISQGTLAPAFAPGHTSYAVSVANAVTSVTVTPVTSDASASVMVNGVTVTSGTPSENQSLNAGANNIPITVTAQDGTMLIYSITVTRAPSTNASLSIIKLTPASALTNTGTVGTTTTYTSSVANATASVTVTPTAQDATATIKVNGVVVTSGTASVPIALAEGTTTTINTVVTAQNGTTTKTYSITVIRAPSSNASLSNLAISNGTLAPVFAGRTTGYTATVSNATTSIIVTPTAADANASLNVNGTVIDSGAPSGSISLAVGQNTINIGVAAQDGTTIKTYSIVVTRAPSTNAALSVIKLTPASALTNTGTVGTTTTYTTSVANAIASVTVTPTAQDANATIKVNGVVVVSGTASGPVALAVGQTIINTIVTAQDGVTTRTYSIIVTRAAIAPVITYTTPDVYTVGAAITQLVPNNTGGTTTSYSINPVPPPGMIFNTTTGVISGTPTTVSAATNYTITATNPMGNSTFTITITVVPPRPVISYTTPNTYVVGTTITQLVPNNSGGTPNSYSVSGLPPGLTLDPTTGIISGTPTAVSAATNYTITATNPGGSGTFTITIAVVPPRPVIAYATPDTYVVGTTITQLVPNNSGGAPTSYSSSGLPPGLLLDPTTGVISGTLTTVSAATNYTITATNPGGSGTAVIIITILPVPPIIAYNTPDIFTVGAAIAPLTPVNSGSTPTSYSINTALPAGLTFNTATGVISGKPTTVTPATVYTVTATDPSGNTGNTTLNISVTQPLSANATLSIIKLTPASALTNTGTVGTTTTYTTSVANATATVTVTPTAQDAAATIKVNGVTVASGTASGQIALAEGTTTTINTVVTAQNGTTTKTYSITVTRAPSGNAALSNLTISSGTLAPVFAAGTTGYTATVSNTTTSIKVTPTAADANGKITVNGVAVASGTLSGSIALAVGQTTITTTVTAQDGTTIKTYAIVVTRLSNNALLSIIKLTPASALTNTGTISTTTTYTTSVSNATTSVTVTPTAQDVNAAIKVNGAVVASGTASGSIALAVGQTTITTVVTAQDGATTHTYSITVTRATGALLSLYQPVQPASVVKPTDNITIENDDIMVHQGVSPNGDGIDDFLTIDGINQYPDNNLMIIDRNGSLLYQAKGYDNSSNVFDGHSNINGKLLQSGTYFYSLDYKVNGQDKHKTGFILLKY